MRQGRDDSWMDRLDLRKLVPQVRLQVVHERPEEGSDHAICRIGIPSSCEMKLARRKRRQKVLPDRPGQPLHVIDSKMAPTRRRLCHRGGVVHDYTMAQIGEVW